MIFSEGFVNFDILKFYKNVKEPFSKMRPIVAFMSNNLKVKHCHSPKGYGDIFLNLDFKFKIVFMKIISIFFSDFDWYK